MGTDENYRTILPPYVRWRTEHTGRDADNHTMSDARPLGTPPATDEVIDAIAGIEMQRQATMKAAGVAASCSSALRSLLELLDREKKALAEHGPDAGHPENVEAVAAEIERVKGLAAATNPGPAPRGAYPGQRKATWRDAQRSPARKKGRRTMGRGGGR
jgi:hypothetical protein